jgi:hypothetical protein
LPALRRWSRSAIIDRNNPPIVGAVRRSTPCQHCAVAAP